MPWWHLPAKAGRVRECGMIPIGGGRFVRPTCEGCGCELDALEPGWNYCEACSEPERHELPTLLAAAWRYVADGRRSPVAPAGDVAAVVDHVREGFGRWVARSARASSGSVACGVDSCPNLIVDPTRCAGLFVFTPGLDVVGICERCARVASGDVAAAPGCFGAVPSLYVFGSETDGRGERSGGAE